MKALLLSTVQQDRSIVLKFYDPITNRVILWKDTSDYKPFCYVTPETIPQIKEFVGINRIEETELRDIIQDKTIKISKVICNDTNVINKSLIPTYKVWEGDIKVQNSYLYDNGFQVGKWYEVKKDYIELIEGTSSINLGEINTEGIIEKEKFLKNVSKWAQLLNEPIPEIRRIAFDIEVEAGKDTMPDPSVADQRVTAISFHSDDLQKVFVLKRDMQLGEDITNVEDLVWFDSEKEMLEKAFDIIESYPICLTFNGDQFDMPYLYNRAIQLGIVNIPFKMLSKNATLSMGIHLDMYTIFKNRSLKIYAFKSKYVEDGLDSVSKALLGEGKLEYEGNLQEIPLYTLAHYCYNDSRLTYNLSAYNNNLVMNLMVIISRISNLSIDECSRYAISAWIKSLLYYTHRQNQELVPKSEDFPKIEASTQSSTDKKYEGAIVLEPTAGIHFDVKVMDFASLYPSIIKVKNVSYETVNCSHEECKSNKVPFTTHHICIKHTGIVSMLIGSLKELRVGHFKKLSKTAATEQDKTKYETISEALKVFLNASYGVIGYDEFPLYYLPTAETVTAFGRSIISETVKAAKDLDMTVLYGDTDSIFLKAPTKEQVQSLIQFAKNTFNIDIEQDKTYRYVVLSNRRKNYFGIKPDGSADIKGLSGKKSNTPPFIRGMFSEIIKRLGDVKTSDDFQVAKDWIIHMVQGKVRDFENIPLEELAFNYMIRRQLDEYKVKPPAIKAMEQLGIHIHVGQFIQFIKTRGRVNVKPISMVQRNEIDKEKYMESLQTVMKQITEPMDIDIEELMGHGHALKLSEFF